MDQASARADQLLPREPSRGGTGRTGPDRRNLVPVLSVLAIILIAVMTRLPHIGDPAIHMDEQFYLLVADRIWRGALPYVDVWDRKPIGLFLVYALLRPFSADGVIAYQIGALLSAIATALILRGLALRFSDACGALAVGMLYLLFLPLTGGAGGQSPVFYNLPIALAALFCVKAGNDSDPGNLSYHGRAAMALCGLAIQIKYSVIIEGMFLGLWLLGVGVRNGLRRRELATMGVQFVLIALLPTFVVGLAYAVGGHFSAFFDANFLSIFRVSAPSMELRMQFLKGGLLATMPLLMLATLSFVITLVQARGAARWFLPLWTCAAGAGFAILGNNYNHYMQPVLLPLCLLCGVAFQGRFAVGAVAIGACWYAIVTGWPSQELRDIHQKRIQVMAQTLEPYAERGCLYINDGPTVLYLLTRSCLPSPYIFPEHLNNAGESDATSAPAAMARLLAGRPSAIMIVNRRLDHPRNEVTAAMLDRALKRDYREVARLPDVLAGRTQIIYARNDVP